MQPSNNHAAANGGSPTTIPSVTVSPVIEPVDQPSAAAASTHRAPPIPSLGTLAPTSIPNSPATFFTNDSVRSSTTRFSPRTPSVQIRRMRSGTTSSVMPLELISEAISTSHPGQTGTLRINPPPTVALSNRLRSPSSPPLRGAADHLATAARPLSIASTAGPGSPDSVPAVLPSTQAAPSEAGSAGRKVGRRRAFTSAVPSAWRYSRSSKPGHDEDRQSLTSSAAMSARQDPDEMYSQHLVDLLDVIDPEVATVSSLANVQNSLFVPNLGRFSRAPVIKLSPLTTAAASRYSKLMEDMEKEKQEGKKSAEYDVSKPLPPVTEKAAEEGPVVHGVAQPQQEGHWAVMPEDVDWTEWTQEEKDEIDDYVRHLLHSKKEKARRRWRGFRKFASKPFGLFITIYASLLTFWGAAWVLFLIGWINVGERKDYFVNICDQILVALFCLVGIGMFPFRLVDTYHMIYIAHFHRKSLRLRREKGLPSLKDDNDLPPPVTIETAEGGLAIKQDDPEQVLTLEEEEKFLYHQTKFCHSHTFYRPHETATHFAFPLDLLIVIVCLLDAHSCFQCALGGCTWGISYKVRPAALTASILACSLSCNITSGLLIAYGDRKIRKKDVMEKQLRQALTEEAIKRKEMERKIASRHDTEQEELLAKEGLQALKKINDESASNSQNQSQTSLNHIQAKHEY